MADFAERLYFHLVFKSHYMSLMKDQMAKRAHDYVHIQKIKRCLLSDFPHPAFLVSNRKAGAQSLPTDWMWYK